MAFKLVNTGFKQFGRMLNPRRFRDALKLEVGKTTAANAEFLEQSIKDTIDGARIGPGNKPLTVMTKGRDHPVLDSGKVRDAVEGRVIDWKTATVGIPENSPAYRVAKIVHDGANVPVTDKMRLMFRLLWFVSMGTMEASRLQGRAAELWDRSPTEWFPLSETTRMIRIPPRPFIDATVERADVKARIRHNYLQALANTWRTHVKSAKEG